VLGSELRAWVRLKARLLPDAGKRAGRRRKGGGGAVVCAHLLSELRGHVRAPAFAFAQRCRGGETAALCMAMWGSETRSQALYTSASPAAGACHDIRCRSDRPALLPVKLSSLAAGASSTRARRASGSARSWRQARPAARPNPPRNAARGTRPGRPRRAPPGPPEAGRAACLSLRACGRCSYR